MVRVGGLAEAASGLVKALRADGVEVVVAVPDYFGTPLRDTQIIALTVPDWLGPATARLGDLDGFGPVALIDGPGIARPHPYMRPDGQLGWDDNDKRFIGFSAACAALAVAFDVELVHANDWHTAATFAFLAPSISTVFGLHNLAYQGECDIGWTRGFPRHGAAYEHRGACNPLAGALRVADRVVAVSPTYAKEITTQEHGAGLDDTLRERGRALLGIRNGIDVSEWNPATDRHLPRPYGANAVSSDASAKHLLRRQLRDRFGLIETEGPLIGMITRLVHQKGLDLVIGLGPFLTSVDAQLLVLGSGDPAIADQLTRLARDHPDRVAFFEGYDVALSHQVCAGADLYLMPSRFEPCGLGQMQAMEYGTIPIVTDVGGLHDTVIDADVDPVRGTGFVAKTLDLAGVVDALHRSVRAWNNIPRRVDIIGRGMRTDWSWSQPARWYRELYEALTAGRA